MCKLLLAFFEATSAYAIGLLKKLEAEHIRLILFSSDSIVAKAHRHGKYRMIFSTDGRRNMYLPENFFETCCADGNKEARRPSHVYQTRKLFLLQFEKKNSTQNIVWYPENFETCISEAGEVRSKEHSCLAEFIYPEAAPGPCLRKSISTSPCFWPDEVFRKIVSKFRVDCGDGRKTA
jgi:hypothetical protein